MQIGKKLKILVVDDNPAVNDVLCQLCSFLGHEVVTAQNGAEGLALVRRDGAIAMVFTDFRMPVMNGVEICKRLRASSVHTPIIVLSAVGDEVDKVLLLEIGADDYVVKPFGRRELLARIRAVLRRASPEAHKVIRFGDVAVDVERRIIERGGQQVKVTPAEYNLLCYFLQNPDRVLTRDMILNSVWGYESYPNTRTVDAHVVKLRQKFEPDPAAPRHFLTVHGVGYRFLS